MLVVVLGLAAAIPLYFAAAAIRDVASASQRRPGDLHRPVLARAGRRRASSRCRRSTGFLAYVAPLLGLAFAFDAINGERAEGTLPRLLSQPIHRDDVVNGKFAPGSRSSGSCSSRSSA